MSLRRHSVRIAGHATSVSIEDAFWAEVVQNAAREDGISAARLIERIDRERSTGLPPGAAPPNLSSALRLYVLDRLKNQARD